MYVYARAEIAGSIKLYSRLLTEARHSESFWVLIEFQQPYVPTIASIQYMFTLRNRPDGVGARGTFYAVVRLYKAQRLPGHGRHLKPIYRVKPKDYDVSTHKRHNGRRVVNLAVVSAKMHRFYDVTECNTEG